MRFLKQALTRAPDPGEPLIALVGLHVSQERYSEVETLLREKSSSLPSASLSICWATSSECRMRSKKPILNFLRASEFKPGWAVPHRNLARTRLAQGNFQRAIDAYRRGLESVPHLAIITVEFGQAARVFQRVTQSAPSEPVYNFHLGMAHHARGNENLALRHLELALDSKREFDGMEDARQALAQPRAEGN